MKRIISILALLLFFCIGANASNLTVKPINTNLEAKAKVVKVKILTKKLPVVPITLCSVSNVVVTPIGEDMLGNMWYSVEVTLFCINFNFP